MSGGGAFGANRVGGIIPAKGEIELNAGRPVTKLKVRNTGDRPVQIGSHFHFFEVNRAIEMDREKAFGKHLNIPAATAVRLEPGMEQDVAIHMPVEANRSTAPLCRRGKKRSVDCF